MSCGRCRGLMVPLASLLYESNVDYQVDTLDRRLAARAWRCVNCGDVTDPVIHDHRRLQAARPVLLASEVA